MFFLYNAFLKAATLLLLPFLLPVLLFSPKWRAGLRERLAWPTRKIRESFQSLPRPRVWFHAASMGEVAAIVPIASAFKERNPHMAVIISTSTVTGRKEAARAMAFASHHILMPLDFPGMMRRIIRMVQPDLLIIAETELWPNLVREAKRFGSQVALVNGRMSEKSLRGYRWFVPIFRKMLDSFDLILVQTEKDAERYHELGANAQRTKVLGNVKFDAAPAVGNAERLREELRIPEGRPVWVAGSVRPGEEEIVVKAWSRVKAQVPNAVLILAPRHLERVKILETLLSQERQPFTRRTRIAHELLDFPVILLDTLGELSRVYGLAGVAFVGGSLAPFGGHNPLEPASQGVPVLFGPHMENFTRTAEILLKNEGARTVADEEELAAQVVEMLSRPEKARHRGRQARQAVLAFQGVAGRSVDMLQKLMLIKRWASEVRQWREESLQTPLTISSHNEVFQDEFPE